MPHQMFDEDGTSETKFRGDGVGNICRDAEFFVILKPDDVKVAVALHEIIKESFYRMDRMKKLESI